MSKPLVSVIVPTIGRSAFFVQALASLAAQTYSKIEVFISDNASETPVSRPEVEAVFAGRQLRFVRREKRMPFADHFNACLREASGLYAMFLSDDDLLVPQFVEKAVQCIESEPGVGVVLSRQTKLDETYQGGAPNEPLSWEVFDGNSRLQNWWELGEPMILTCVSLFARRELMVKVGGFGEYHRGSYSDIRLLFALGIGRRLGILSGGFLYRVYPASNGLAMSWAELELGTNQFELELVRWRKEGRISGRLSTALVRSNTSTLLSRYRTLYRGRPGFENKARPLFDLAARLFVNFLRYGPAGIPVLHRILGRLR